MYDGSGECQAHYQISCQQWRQTGMEFGGEQSDSIKSRSQTTTWVKGEAAIAEVRVHSCPSFA